MTAFKWDSLANASASSDVIFAYATQYSGSTVAYNFSTGEYLIDGASDVGGGAVSDSDNETDPLSANDQATSGSLSLLNQVAGLTITDAPFNYAGTTNITMQTTVYENPVINEAVHLMSSFTRFGIFEDGTDLWNLVGGFASDLDVNNYVHFFMPTAIGRIRHRMRDSGDFDVQGSIKDSNFESVGTHDFSQEQNICLIIAIKRSSLGLGSTIYPPLPLTPETTDPFAGTSYAPNPSQLLYAQDRQFTRKPNTDTTTSGNKVFETSAAPKSTRG